MVADAPVVMLMALEVEQVETAVPASAVTGVLMMKDLVEMASAHGAFPVAVNVNVTDPAVISAGLGSYVAVVNEFGFVKVPVPLDVQVTVL